MNSSRASMLRSHLCSVPLALVSVGAVAAAMASDLAATETAQASASELTDRYGGWTGFESTATGFFRIEQRDDRWWFITPDGHPFLSAGVNHVDYQQDYSASFVSFVTSHLRDWGFNTIGWSQEIIARDANNRMIHSRGWGPDQYNLAHMPYMHLLRFTDMEWYVEATFPDVFSREFEEHCDRIARETCSQLADDPWLIGYFYADAPNWPLWRQTAGADRIGVIAERYYRVIHDAIRRYDRNHLLLGDRYKGDVSIPLEERTVNGMPVEILDAMRETVDVLSVEYYRPLPRMELDLQVWHQITGKPVLIADSAFLAPTDVLQPSRKSPVFAADQQSRGRAYAEHASRLYANPLVIGYHWCAFGRSSGRRSGLLDGDDRPYADCVRQMAQFNTRKLYTVADVAASSLEQDLEETPAEPATAGAAAKSDPDQRRDRYGATTVVRGRTTGYFDVQQIGDRWWFVSPQGNGFLSVGMNHLDLAALKHHDNREVFENRYAGSTDRLIREGMAAPLRSWGFNTIGWTQELVGGTWGVPGSVLRHSDEWDIRQFRLAGLPFIYNFTFAEIEQFNERAHYPDVFSDEFADWADYLARTVCVEMVREPLLLGYADVPVPDFTSGRSGSWSEGMNLDDPSDRDRLQRIANRYFEVVTAAIRRYDTNHLIFGPRFGHPADTPDWLIETAGRHFDVILCNRFVTQQDVDTHLERWHRLSQRPILIADTVFLAPTELLSVGPRAQSYVADQSARGRASQEFAQHAFRQEYVVGLHWCAFIENRTRKSGIKNYRDEPYWDCVLPVSDFNHSQLYSTALSE